MLYIEQAPSTSLTSYIDKFWYCKADELNSTAITIPLLHHEFVLNFSDYYSLTTNIEGNLIANTQSWISGIQKTAMVSRSKGKHEMMGVLFKINGLKSFIRQDSIDFANKHIDSELVFGNNFKFVVEEIYAARSPRRKLDVIENYLISKFARTNTPEYIDASLSLFNKMTDMKISIKDTCKSISISNKSFIQSYQKHIGLTPKKYTQLRLINKALEILSKEPNQSLTKLAYTLNFYDQAHFTTLFKAITSITPLQYKKYVMNNKVDKDTANYIFL